MKDQIKISVNHSTLDADAIGGFIIKNYDLQLPIRCELMARGVNDIYLLRSKNTKYAVRILRSGSRTQDEINYEMNLIKFFRKSDFNAASPIEDKNGLFSSTLSAPEGKRYLTIFEWAKGKPLADSMDKEKLKKLGIYVSKMHLIAKDFTTIKRIKAITTNYILTNLEALIKILENDPKEANFYEKLAYKTCSEFDKIKKEEVAYGATHSDIHPHNVFINDDDNEMTLIDWDLCGDDYLVKELTSLTWRLKYLNSSQELIDSYIEGYESIRPFSKYEKELSNLFFTMRHLFTMCGIASVINIIGHNFIGYKHNLERYKEIVKEPAQKAGLIKY